ncbi:MAG: dehydratase [Dehalococcoidia bacterium]|nr:dehydratase [Dehalococcoidia bacterium]|tara:strand:- start:314 stop:769 length:456 start_codon:yes stop_codon:yes gene_type:complete
MKSLKNLQEVKSLVGSELGVSKWHQITQFQISKFGKVTGDEQWIHTAPIRAKLLSPFKSTIAHGFLVLSLLPKFLEETYSIKSAKMGVNYGLNRVRFTAPVPVKSFVRGRVILKDFKEIKNGGKLIVEVTVELKNSDKPACVAEQVFLIYE